MTVSRVLLGVSAAGACWALILALTGGFDTAVFTAHDSVKPLLLATVALAVHRAVANDRDRHGAPEAVLPRSTCRAIAAVLAIAISMIGFVYGAKVAGGSDSWGYLSEAELWRAGSLSVDQSFAKDAPWPDAKGSFVPLAYRLRGTVPDDSSIVPICFPGLPLMLAAVKSVGGQTAMFWVVPIFAALLVYSTFLIGQQLASPLAGLVGAWLVATSPIVLYMSVVTMNDAPAAALVATAFWLLCRSSRMSALGAGMLAGLAVLVRANLLLLVGVMVLSFILTPAPRRRTALEQALFVLLGLAPFLAGLAVFNHSLFGSAISVGYGAAGDFSVSNLVPNVSNYLRWLSETATPLAFVGVLAVLIPIRQIWAARAERRLHVIVALFVLTLWSFYSLYTVFDAWTYLRFLLPSWPFVMLGTASVAVWAMSSTSRSARAIVAMMIVTLGCTQFQMARRHGVFHVWVDERRYVEAGRLARALTPENAVILSMQHSGSLRYYGGRMTLKYDVLPASWIDPAVNWLTTHGARTYLLAEDWELPIVRERFAGTRTVEALERPPVATFDDPAALLLFDLSVPRSSGDIPERMMGIDQGLGAAEPAPPPRLLLAR